MVKRGVRLAFTIGALVDSVAFVRGIVQLILALTANSAFVPCRTSHFASLSAISVSISISPSVVNL